MNPMTLLSSLRSLLLTHKYLSLAGIIILGGGGYALYSHFKTEVSTEKVYTVRAARLGTISSSISGEGQVIADSQVTLKPIVAGTISVVSKKAGETVKKGDTIATIYSYDAIKAVRDARLARDQAKLSLDKILAGPTDLEATQIDNAVAQANDSKTSQGLSVSIARKNLLNSGLQVIPRYSFSSNIPTLGGSYTCDQEGTYSIKVQGDTFDYSGLENGIGSVSTTNVPLPLGSCGLTLTFQAGVTYSNGDWTIDIPNTRSTSYVSTLNSYTNTLTNASTTIAQADRTIKEQTAKKNALINPDHIDLETSKLTLTQRENALMDAQNNLSNYTITAPFDGTLSSLSLSVGDYVNQSSSLGVLTTVRKLAQVTLNEVDVAKIKMGQKAMLTFDALPDAKFTGDVVDVDSVGTVSQGVVSYNVKIAFDNDSPDLKVGMSVSATIVTDEKSGVLAIPTSAITTKNGKKVVLVVDNVAKVKEIIASRRAQFASSSGQFGMGAQNEGTSTMRASTSRASFAGGASGGTRAGAAGITISSNDTTTREVTVTVGMQSDKESEITSGLSEGDIVVTKTEAATAAAATTAAKQTPSLLNSIAPRGGGR